MCQHVSTKLQQQISEIQVIQKSVYSQQEIIQKQGRQIKILVYKLERLTNIIVDNFQEAVEDIEEAEYEEDWYGADQYPRDTLPWDVGDGSDADESKEELLQEEVVTTQKVGSTPPTKKGREGVSPAPTKFGTPPNRTKDVTGYTTPHSSFESIPEEESKEPPKKWDNCLRTSNHSTGMGAPCQGKLRCIRKRTALSTAVWEG